eukprot:14438905-Ditylum_brightwellii.AAC.1
MDEIFTRFGEAGLQANISKSALFQKVLEFVGFWLELNGYRPLASRIQALMDMNPPKDKCAMQTFNRMINFIKNHIPQRQVVMEPITRLTCNNKLYVWGEEQQAAFQESKMLVSEAMMLSVAGMLLMQDELGAAQLSHDGQGVAGSTQMPESLQQYHPGRQDLDLLQPL